MESDDWLQNSRNRFWYNIEQFLNYRVSNHIKNILKYSDLDSAVSLKIFREEQILDLEKCVRDEKYKMLIPENSKLEDYYGRYHSCPVCFIFSIGEKLILKQMIDFTRIQPTSFWEISDCKSSRNRTLTDLIEKIDEFHNTYKYNNDKRGKGMDKSSLLQMILQSLHDNSEAKSKEGYRYQHNLKMISSYLYLIGGKTLYETLSANLPLPSPATIHRFINTSAPKIIEGACRIEELKDFLLKRNLPKFVWVSEDATRMVSRIQYDSRTNQLVGFVQPLNENNSMPLTNSFKATSVKVMENHFRNNRVSSLLYCYIVQPMKKKSPSFCFNIFGTDNSFTAEDSVRRWSFITKLLEDNGIRVLGYSSDGDPRLLKAMRMMTNIGVTPRNESFKIDGFHAEYKPNQIFIQDTVHLVTKLKTRLFKISVTLPIGNYIISASHVKYLLYNFSKDKHLLTKKDIDGKDKMNFGAVLKISHERVIKLLEREVIGSKGTQEYLKIINYITYAFLSTELRILTRLYCMWYSLFFFRMWRQWLSRKESYSVVDNFISLNTYMCIEINAHGLLNLILKGLEDETLNDHLLFHQMGSQPCEGFYRTLRSLSTVFCTVVNCSVLEAIRKTEKISLVGDIMVHDFGNDSINFPRNTCLNPSFEKIADKDVFGKLEEDTNFSLNVDMTSICKILQKAKDDALKNIKNLGVNDVSLSDADSIAIHGVDTSIADLIDVHYEDPENILSDESNDTDLRNQNEEYLDEDERIFTSDLYSNLQLKEYSERYTVTSEEDPWIEVLEGDMKKTIRKASICYILNKDVDTLSSDRLVRVQSDKIIEKNSLQRLSYSAIRDVTKLTHINILHWCLFENEETKKCLLGFVLGFGFYNETRWKQIEYSKDYVDISRESTKNIGVLCDWFNINKKNGTIKSASMESHGYIDISSYKLTLPSPEKEKDRLFISRDMLKKIQNLI